MNRFVPFLAMLFLCYHSSLGQPSRADSLSGLISQTGELNEKARLYVLRSKAWPNSQTDKPLADAQQALAYYQQSKNEEGQVDAYLQVSVIYGRLNKYKLALDFDSAAYSLAHAAGYKKGMAIALGSMGRSYQQLGNFKQSELNCLQSLKLLQDAGLESETAETYNRLGVVYRRLSNYKKSLHSYDEGIAVARKFKNDPILATLYMNKANTLHESARYDEAIEMHLQSIRIKERIRDERGLLQSYNNIALVYMRSKQYALSTDYFFKANKLAVQFKSHTSMGYNYTNLATLYIALKQTDSVPHFFEQALAAFKVTGEKPGLGLVYHNYGNFLMETDKLAEAETMLRKALELRQETNSRFDIASTMNVLGSLLTKQNKNREAEQLLLQSLAMLKGENSLRQKDVYRYLADHYNAVNNYEEAYKYQAGYISLKDTLVNENEVVDMLKAQSQYESEKKDAEMALAKKDRQLQQILLSKTNQQVLYLLIALVLALLLAFVFYLVYRNKKQHAIVLQTKNGQIETLIRELHHRVKNNLQVVSGLLSLQSNRMEDEAARQAMDDGRNRVEAMAMIHQKLYMDKEIAGVDIKEYLQNLSASLAGSFGFNAAVVSTDVQITSPSMDIDRAIPIGLIVNELITNAFKHAFTGVVDPIISVRLLQADNELELQITDNGSGYQIINNKAMSFGMKLVHTLVSQLDGKMEMHQDGGTVYSIKMRA